MAITFPNSPSSGDTHTTSNGLQYTYDGEKWTTIGTNSAGTWTRTGTTVALTTATDNLSANTATFGGAVNFDDDVIVKGDGTNGSGELTLNCENNSHGVKIKGPPHSAAANYTLVLPNDTGTSGQALTTNGSGVSSWLSVLPLTGGTVNGQVVIGGDANNGTAEGLQLNSSGFIQISRGGGVSALWAGYTQGSSTQTSRIDNDGDAHFLGSVGIGNSSPSSYNSDGRNLVVGSGSGGQGLSIASGNSSYGTIYFADGTSGDALYRGAVLYNHASDFMRFDTAAGERMRIDSSGNVGIGTSAPSYRLEVNETSANSVTRFSGANSANLVLRNATSNVFELNAGGSNDALSFGTAGNNERMRIAADGVAHFNGDVKVLNGDIQMGSGRGINFSANSHATGMTSETLDDYEEGTWTPAIQGLSNTPSYHNLAGKYTKIGRVVYLQGFLQMNALATFTNNNDIYQIGGVPYAASNGVGYYRAQGTFNAQQMGINGAYNDYGVTGQASVGFETTTTIGFQVTSNYSTRGRIRNSAGTGALILEFSITYAIY